MGIVAYCEFMGLEGMTSIELWEFASYVVTVIALPFGILVFMIEQRKERQTEEEELYQRLSDEYADFSRLLLENADLHLFSIESSTMEFSSEQRERKKIIFDILISLFERAFILVYEEHMSKQTARLWASWEDYIRFWCRRSDFHGSLVTLLQGEDPEFVAYMLKIDNEENSGRVVS